MLRQRRRDQAAWSVCTPKQAAKLLRTKGTKYIMVNVQDRKQPVSQATDSTLPTDQERGGKKQVGGKPRHPPHPFRTDHDERAGSPPIPVGDQLPTYLALAQSKPGGPSKRPRSNNPETPRAGSVLPVQQTEAVSNGNAAIVTDSQGDRNGNRDGNGLLKSCLGQTQTGQEPNTTPQMTDAEADKAGLVRCNGTDGRLAD